VLQLTYDVVCPFAFVGAVRIAEAARHAGVKLAWNPILLGGLLRELGGDPDPNAAMPAAKQAHIRRDAIRQASLAGLEIRFPAEHPRRTVMAMRLCAAASDEVRPALSLDLWRAYWTLGLDVADRGVLAEIAARHGLSIDVVDDPAVKDALRARTTAAAEAGVFGVPSFRVDNSDPE
jgi:2-hydroxychromene-2-carboxylate isomerase